MNYLTIIVIFFPLGMAFEQITCFNYIITARIYMHMNTLITILLIKSRFILSIILDNCFPLIRHTSFLSTLVMIYKTETAW